VAFAMEQFHMTDRRACKLVALDRSSYRYVPKPDHNSELRQELISLARQKEVQTFRVKKPPRAGLS
jgi:hypothetical protein